MENSLKPSEQLLGKQHQPGMRADLQLLCGIYDLLHEIKATLSPEVHVHTTLDSPAKSSARPKKSE